MFEVISLMKGKEWAGERARKYCEHRGLAFDYEWVDQPWAHQRLKESKINYEKNWFLPFEGRIKD